MLLVLCVCGYDLSCSFALDSMIILLLCLFLQTVRIFLKNILDRGEIDKQSSVAIPAIGTGNLHIPHKIIADIMFDEVLKFGKQQKPKFLLNIHFVVYDKDIDSIKVSVFSLSFA